MKNAVFWDVSPCGSVSADVSEQRVASMIRVERIGELGKTLALTSNWSTLRRNTDNTSKEPIDWDPGHIGG
jgi:hypothetical protein